MKYYLKYWDNEDKEEYEVPFDTAKERDHYVRFRQSCNDGFEVIDLSTREG